MISRELFVQLHPNHDADYGQYNDYTQKAIIDGIGHLELSDESDQSISCNDSPQNINAGRMMNPPPTPTKPVNTPTQNPTPEMSTVCL